MKPSIKIVLLFLLVCTAALLAGISHCYAGEAHQSCSTVLLKSQQSLLIGHNLDDYIDVPGLIFVNKRGISKFNISWKDFYSPFGKGKPELRWISKYGSITYNTFGREFPDGGMNEAGLYVGEMTLMDTQYPDDKGIPKLHHHIWMQHLLDNFATVDEVLASLTKVQISGHCQWHFFIADKEGHTAVIEFLNGAPKVHANDQMPIKALCNRSYVRDIEILHQYKDFGGTIPINYSDKENDRRFVWAAAMLNQYKECSDSEAYGKVFEILKQLDLGNNKWTVVYDMMHQRIWFNTYKGRSIRFADFSAFDFSNKTPIMILDINRNLSGDVSKYFVPFNDSINSRFIKETFSQIDFGFFGNIFVKSSYVSRLSEYTKEFK